MGWIRPPEEWEKSGVVWCAHYNGVELVEHTTKGWVKDPPGPDVVNTYTFRCRECGCILKGKFKKP